MTNMIVKNSMERGTMEMDNLLDMLQKARVETGIVGITQKTKEEQGAILRSLMHKFDAASDMQTVIESKWGLDKKRKGTDPEEKINEIECRKKNK